MFDDLLHIDLFTVTMESFTERDYFRVLYDPNNLLNNFVETQTLTLSENEFSDAVEYIAWFLFQYKKAAARGNDIWAVKMLTNIMEHIARVLLFKYSPSRAQLGLKTLHHSLPENILFDVNEIFKHITPMEHQKASLQISQLVSKEFEWIIAHLTDKSQIEDLFQKMVEFHIHQDGRK